MESHCFGIESVCTFNKHMKNQGQRKIKKLNTVEIVA